MYDFTVFIGRMQPPHAGHFKVIREALAQSNKLIIVLGNPDAPRTPRNPFSYTERIDFVQSGLTDDELNRVEFTGVNDHSYNDDVWCGEVQTNVMRCVKFLSEKEKPTIALIGHSKDHTSYYLRKFPQWGSIDVENYSGLNATQIRNIWYNDLPHNPGEAVMPTVIWNRMQLLKSTNWYARVSEEVDFLAEHAKMWEAAPYPVTFQTCDTVVVAAGHVLLVQRRSTPGKGLWALPGGYLNAKTETLEEGAIRELNEETKVAVSKEVLRRNIREAKTYDAVNRSERGRIITRCFHIELSALDGKGNIELPKVKGSDDAAEARWWNLDEVTREMMFEDHYLIIRHFANTLPAVR